MAAKVQEEVVYKAGEHAHVSDIWDDTALIEAYDRAVNIMKNGQVSSAGPSKGKGGGKNKKQQTGKRSGSKKKENKKAESNVHVDSSLEWQVGDACRAVYTDDEGTYEALIIYIDTEAQTCIVKYEDYGNEEEQNLRDLMQSTKRNNKYNRTSDQDYNTVDSPYYPHSTHHEGNMEWSSPLPSPQWSVSDLCLAAEYPSGHLHQAVINAFPTAYTCKVTFIRSRRSQEVNTSSLHYCNSSSRQQSHTHLHHTPPQFPHRTPQYGPFPTATYPPWQSFTPPTGNYMFPPSVIPPPMIPPGLHSTMASNSLHLPNPPMPPVPPHPLTNADNTDDNALASMLMSWYLSGYHTGYFQGLQQSQYRRSEGCQTQPVTTATAGSQCEDDSSETSQEAQNS